MLRKFKAMVPILVLAILSTSLMAGCTSKETDKAAVTTTAAASSAASESSATPAATQEEVKEVTLNCYYPNSPVTNFDKIMEEVNKIAKEKINAKINFTMIESAQFAQRLNLMIASKDPFDVTFSAHWGDYKFYDNAAKGAYYSLNDIIEKNAPQSKAKVPEGAWGAVTVDGKIYGIPNYQIWGLSAAYGVVMKKSFVEKYNFDYAKMTKLADLEPYLEAVKKGEPAGTIPIEFIGGDSGGNSWFTAYPTLFGYDGIGEMKSVGWVSLDDTSLKVINQFETPAFKEHLMMMRSWYQKGYIKKDAATIKDLVPDRKAEKTASVINGCIPDTVQMPELASSDIFSMSDPKNKVYAVSKVLGKPVIPAQKPAECMECVGANSPNPVRALQWIELVNTNNDIWALLNYGREGIDYKRIDDRHIEQNLDSYDFHWGDWVIGQSNGRPQNWLKATDDAVTWDKRLQIISDTDKTAQPSPVTGFIFNPTNVKTELANTGSVMAEMLSSLGSGSIDPEKFLPQFLSKLKAAGADAIVAEKQKQIDEWKKATGK